MILESVLQLYGILLSRRDQSLTLGMSMIHLNLQLLLIQMELNPYMVTLNSLFLKQLLMQEVMKLKIQN